MDALSFSSTRRRLARNLLTTDAKAPASRGRTVAQIRQKERFMEQVIECPCGTVLRGADLREVIDQAQTHAHEVHDMELSDEQATSMARPA